MNQHLGNAAGGWGERLRRSWPWLALGAVALGYSYKTIADLDIWWHLAAGRWMWEHQEVVKTDPFTYTAFGLPWVSITWGYELLCYLLSSRLEWVTLMHCVLAVGATLGAWRTFLLLSDRTSGRSSLEISVGLLLFIYGLSVVEPRWIHRPEMFTHCLGAWILSLLVQEWRHRGETPERLVWGLPLRLWAIPALQLVWANTHGIFLFGPFLVGLFWASRAVDRWLETFPAAEGERAATGGDWFAAALRDPLLKVFVLSCLVCLVNPRGWDGAVFPIKLLTLLNNPFFQRTIPEATNPFRDVIWGRDTWALFWWGLAVLATILVPFWQVRLRELARRFSWGYIVFAPIWVWFGISARRNIALLAIWVLPFLADRATALLVPRLEAGAAAVLARWHRPVAGLAVLVALLLQATNLYRPAYGDVRFGAGITLHYYPEGARDFLAENRVTENLFANVEAADYLLFTLPGFKPYIDGRFAELYPIEHFRRYMDILAHPFLLDQEAKSRGIEGAVLSPSSPISRHLIDYLAHAPDWKLAYHDEAAVVFLTKSRFDRLPAAVRATVDPKSPGAGDEKTPFDRLVERYSQALWEVPLLQRLNARYLRYDRVRPFVQLAEVESILGELDGVKKALEHAKSYNPEHAGAITLDCSAGYLTLSESMRASSKAPETADVDRVERACQKALRVGGQRIQVHQVLGLMYMNMGQMDLAISNFQSVVKLDPISYEGTLMLAQAYAAQGGAGDQLERTIKTYERAAQLRPYDPQPYVQVAEVLSRAGQLDRALAAISQAGQLAPGDPVISSKAAEIRYKKENAGPKS